VIFFWVLFSGFDFRFSFKKSKKKFLQFFCGIFVTSQKRFSSKIVQKSFFIPALWFTCIVTDFALFGQCDGFCVVLSIVGNDD